MRTRQKQRVATDTRRSLGCRTTPLEHWSKRKPTDTTNCNPFPDKLLWSVEAKLRYKGTFHTFDSEGRMWDLIVSVPDHCLFFYFTDVMLLAENKSLLRLNKDLLPANNISISY